MVHGDCSALYVVPGTVLQQAVEVAQERAWLLHCGSEVGGWGLRQSQSRDEEEIHSVCEEG